MKKTNIETRNNGYMITRSLEDSSRHVEGYAVVFDSLSEDLGFFEVIERGAITQELLDNSDVFCLLNHDDNEVLARSNKGKGSLTLTVDDTGVKYAFDCANTQVGNDLLEYIKRGEIVASSFCFALDESDDTAETWTYKDGKAFRTIHKIAWVHDVSPVWNPAYSATSVSQRSLDKVKELQEQRNKEILANLDSKLLEINSL